MKPQIEEKFSFVSEWLNDDGLISALGDIRHEIEVLEKIVEMMADGMEDKECDFRHGLSKNGYKAAFRTLAENRGCKREVS